MECCIKAVLHKHIENQIQVVRKIKTVVARGKIKKLWKLTQSYNIKSPNYMER